MRILHITPHLGGGVGTVLMGWLMKDKSNYHSVLCLDYINKKALGSGIRVVMRSGTDPTKEYDFHNSDIVLIHYWQYPMLKDFLSCPLPPCRLVMWSHENKPVPQKVLDYPDLFLDTSPIQGHGRHIWSSGDMSRFFGIKPKPHEGFNVGYIGTVDYKKMHPQFLDMCHEIAKSIPDVHFIIVGEDHISGLGSGVSVLDNRFTFTGKVDDVAPYLAEMDVFFYPLRPDHYGTCEQALGEAMAAGVVSVVMDNPPEKLIIGDSLDACKDEEECVKAITFLASHTLVREHLSDVARLRARELYDIDRMIMEWNMVFEEMMEKPKKERAGL